jgi:hypothetical protein
VSEELTVPSISDLTLGLLREYLSRMNLPKTLTQLHEELVFPTS